MIFQPEGGVHHWVILRHGAHFEPDALQSTQIVQGRIFCHINIIIPDEPAAQRRQIGQKDKKNDQAAPPYRQRSSANKHSLREGLLWHTIFLPTKARPGKFHCNHLPCRLLLD